MVVTQYKVVSLEAIHTHATKRLSRLYLRICAYTHICYIQRKKGTIDLKVEGIWEVLEKEGKG